MGVRRSADITGLAMAPEFFPIMVTALLVVASLGACLLLSGLFVLWILFRRGIARRWPAAPRVLQPYFVVAVVGALGLLAITATAVHWVWQADLLDEPMANAACGGDIRRFRELLDEGASPDACNTDCRSPAVVCAAENGHDDVVNLLLERGADREGQYRAHIQALRDERQRATGSTRQEH